MPKTKLSDILKNGDDFQISELNICSSDFKIMIDSIIKEKELSKRKKRKGKY